MFIKIVCLISIIFALTSAAPKRTSRSPKRTSRSIPIWHMPCGEDYDLEVPSSSESFEENIKFNVENLRLQHQLTMNAYLNQDFEYLYEGVSFTLYDHQYIPNWLPDIKDTNLVRSLANSNSLMIVNHFPKMHMDLQKFAVAFEELIEDESNSHIQIALKTTQSYLMMMLCEVESHITSLPSLQLPIRVERSIMSNIERNPVDETKRLIRDWGVILKYRNYLHAWRHVFNY
ncbi:uncharacterized protein LOC112637835 [Camponotus floridanus]|uniref:uncharacterized protein LOC112637835 n=1 Tax=Camponotus floridanus TaxID=104421 RepID=UPI000DC68EEF|nr:uncharacterized protein LOC112637835 [Camponotus floridanus]